MSRCSNKADNRQAQKISHLLHLKQNISRLKKDPAQIRAR